LAAAGDVASAQALHDRMASGFKGPAALPTLETVNHLFRAYKKVNDMSGMLR
jgi:hypothetical protein